MTGTPTVLDSTATLLSARVALEQAAGRLPSLQVAVVRDGAVAWAGGRGRAVRRGIDQRPDADTQYRIGSITKTLTAALVLQLRDLGRLDLEDPLSAHVPDAAYGATSVRALLAHRGGIAAEPPGPWWERSSGRSWAQLRTEIADAGPVLPPGRQYHYSNLAYALLGQLVARLHETSWWAAVGDCLLRPLGMTRTSYQPQEPAAQGFSVHPYAGTLTDEPAFDTLAMAPAGQLWSTTSDLAVWAAFLTGSRPDVLTGDTVAEMAIVQSADPGSGSGDAYGLGLRLLQHQGRLLVGHTGSMPGFLAGVFVDRQARVGAVALANGTRGLDGARLGGDLIDTVLEREPSAPPEWVPEDPAGQPSDLLGAWHWGNTPMVLSWSGGMLVLDSAANDQPARFRATGADEFVGLDGYFAGETLRAVRRGNAIAHLDVATFILTREPYDATAPIPGGVAASEGQGS